MHQRKAGYLSSTPSADSSTYMTHFTAFIFPCIFYSSDDLLCGFSSVTSRILNCFFSLVLPTVAQFSELAFPETYRLYARRAQIRKSGIDLRWQSTILYKPSCSRSHIDVAFNFQSRDFCSNTHGHNVTTITEWAHQEQQSFTRYQNDPTLQPRFDSSTDHNLDVLPCTFPRSLSPDGLFG